MVVHHGPPLKDLEGSAPLSDPPNGRLKTESLLNGEDATAHNGISRDCSVAVGDTSATSNENLPNAENGTCAENNGLGLPLNVESSLTDDGASASSGETLMMKSQDIKLEEQDDADERDEDSAASQFCLVKMELDREEESSGKLEGKSHSLLISVADPGCLSRIRIFSSQIQVDEDPGSESRMRIK